MGNNMMLTVGVLALFGAFILGATNILTTNTDAAEDNEYYVASISFAQSIIDEAKTKAFDSKTVTTGVSAPDSLTSPGLLGREGLGETVPNPDTLSITGFQSATKFNDIDDYNGYVRKASTARADGYIMSTVVNYASATYPDSSSSLRTYCKKMIVTVTSPFVTRPVVLSFAFAY